jgi:Creatinase/Prolidase N-terminal domain
MQIKLEPVRLPDFGAPSVEPVLSSATYALRLDKLRRMMRERGLDTMVIYADREHSANMTWLCGYDPRFEEALLVVSREADVPALLVGNEGMGYAELCPSPVRRILYQPLSLMGQDRSKSPDLRTIFIAEGIAPGRKTGLAGWKYFTQEEFEAPQYRFETPAYLADTLRDLAGREHVLNVNDIFMNPVDGLRIFNEAEQLAAFEFAACHTSTGLKNVLFGMKPGMTEYEAAALMGANGIPHAAHTMLSCGRRAAYGLPSPSMNVLKIGEPFTMCMSLWGALNARAGWLARDERDLPAGVRDYVDKLAIPYFRAVAKWYEHVGIGVRGGELYDLIHTEIGDPFFGVHLNPGHYIHLDEWVHSPVFKNSQIALKSGMALQVDVIPATGSAYHTSNIEDGIALADAALREEIAQKFPETWARIQARRAFMETAIGIRLKPEVLPFSNIPAYLPPYMLNPEMVLGILKR